jgi:hypothetical protein
VKNGYALPTMIYIRKGTNLDGQHRDLQVSLQVVMTLPKTFLNNGYKEYCLTAISIHIHSRYYRQDDQERYAFSYKNKKTEEERA